MRLGVFLFVAVLHFATISRAQNYYGCDFKGFEVSFEYQGEVVLNKKFLTNPSEEEYKAAITHQLRYLRGYFISSRKNIPYSLTLNAESPEVTIRNTSNVQYGQKISIDEIHHPIVQIEDPYIQKAIAAKKTLPQDPAIKVTFTTKTKGYFCGRPEFLNEVQTLLPLDPYLAYWTVNSKSRREIKWRDHSFKINPCAHEELVDTPHPYYFWYFWDPNKIGIDAKGKTFNCKSWVKEGSSYFTALPKLQALQSPSETRASNVLSTPENEIKASVIFGILDENEKVFPVENLSQLLGKGKDVSTEDLKRHVQITRKENLNWDRGSLYFMDFLTQIDATLEVEKIETTTSGHEIDFRGKLRSSQKKIHLKVWFGYTDVLGEHKPEHWDFLKKSIQDANYIFYNGHSGLGENFKISNILSETHSSAADLFAHSPNIQMIAYFSCYSYGYFGEDFVEARKTFKPNGKTDILLTATEFTSSRGPLGLLYFLDSVSNQTDHKVDDQPWLFPKDQLILKTYFSKTLEGENKI